MPLFIILRAEEIRDVSPLSHFGTVPNACLCQCGGTGSVAVTVRFGHMTQASLCNLVAHLSQDISEMEIETHRKNLYLNEERSPTPAVDEIAIRNMYKLQQDIITCKSFVYEAPSGT